MILRFVFPLLCLSPGNTLAFQQTPGFGTLQRASASCSASQPMQSITTSLHATADNKPNENEDDRRTFLTQGTSTLLASILGTSTLLAAQPPQPAQATIYLDPAMYGDQELRVSAVDSLRESVRRAILQKPELAPAFYILAIMDGLSFDANTKEGGPDGRIVRAVLSSDDKSEFVALLKDAANAIVDSKKKLQRLSAITTADSVALAGSEAVESIGGPTLSVQLGRMDAGPKAALSPLPLNLLSGEVSKDDVSKAFRRSGLTEREMTAILGGLLTISAVEEGRDKSAGGDWMKSSKTKFRERGKMGRMSEFKRLTDEDIAKELSSEFEDEDDGPNEMGDEEVYIADSFGTRDQIYGNKATNNLDSKSFNRYLKELNSSASAKNPNGKQQQFGWIGSLILDKNTPMTQAWLAKYAASTLNYNKDLGIAYNSITQLGAEFTGGKYENLLKNRPRKSLNDFD